MRACPFEQFGHSRDTHGIATRSTILKPVHADTFNGARREAIERLDAGELVVLPSETVYGLFGRADDPGAVARLEELQTQPAPGAWHAPTAQVVLDAIRPARRAHRRAIRKLLPGPVTIQIRPETPPDLPKGVFDRDGEFAIRVPDHGLLREILGALGGPVVGHALGTVGVFEETHITPESIAPLERAGVALALSDGRTRERKRTTVVRLGDGPLPEIVRSGPIDERSIRRHVVRRIVFVCTGNTCRSPMAATIARHLVARESEPLETEVLSAGLAAGPGAPATAEGVEALREMGYAMGEHHAQNLTLETFAGADAIYTMTDAHARAVLALDPFAPVERLDPEEDIPDPIGGPLEDYRECARVIAAAIERRLKELDP